MRASFFNPARAAEYSQLSAVERLKRDVQTKVSNLQNASIAWAFYVEGIDKATITSTCDMSTRTVENRITLACHALVALIREVYPDPLMYAHTPAYVVPESMRPDEQANTIEIEERGSAIVVSDKNLSPSPLDRITAEVRD